MKNIIDIHITLDQKTENSKKWKMKNIEKQEQEIGKEKFRIK